MPCCKPIQTTLLMTMRIHWVAKPEWNFIFLRSAGVKSRPWMEQKRVFLPVTNHSWCLLLPRRSSITLLWSSKRFTVNSLAHSSVIRATGCLGKHEFFFFSTIFIGIVIFSVIYCSIPSFRSNGQV